jgi:2'-5' RNA ligase
VAGLDELSEAVVRATSAVGEPPDHPRFTGHLTLARLRDRAACGIAGDPISAVFTVDEIHLVRSHQHPEGSRYEVIATRALSSGT